MENEQIKEQVVPTEQITEALVEAGKELAKEEKKSVQNTTTVQLPSNGLLNSKVTHVTLRRMTTMEVKTLYTSKDPNFLTTLLLSCIIEPSNITANDLHPQDILYLLFVLRYISSPRNITQLCRCPECRKEFDSVVNVQNLEVKYLQDSELNEFTVTLPECGDKITFKILSEGELINAEKIAQRQAKQQNLEEQEAEWHSIISRVAYQLIAKNDSEFKEFRDKVKYLENLSGYDFESYQLAYNDIIEKFGLNMKYITECTKCKSDVEVQAYIAPDFFRLV